MPTHSEKLTLGRRLHNALRSAVEDPDHYESGRVTREDFEHYACAMYLAGTLAFLEGKYGINPWATHGSMPSLDEFLANQNEPRATKLRTAGISGAGIQALVCIRNAAVHNDGDLAKNLDKHALEKVRAQNIPGVVLNGSIVQLISNYNIDFMEYVRKSFLAVSMQHGDL